jgi:hypothetical protein
MAGASALRNPIEYSACLRLRSKASDALGAPGFGLAPKD